MSEKYLMRRYDLIGGMDQATNPFLLDDSRYTYLKNVTHGELGTLSKDGGYVEFLDINPSAGSVDLLHNFQNNIFSAEHATEDGDSLAIEDGDIITYGIPNLILKIANGNLYREGGASEWELVSSAITASGNRASSVNYLDRMYFAEPESVVSYTAGTTVTTIAADNGSALVKGKYIEVLNNTLYLGGLTTTHNINEVVYTMPGTHVFNLQGETGHDTYTTTSQIISIDGEVTAIKAFQSLLLIFTEDTLWFFNPDTFEVKQIARTGCVSQETIKEIDGVLYWVNKDGIYRFVGNSLPTLISIPVTNKVVNSLWSCIDGGVWTQLAAGVLDGKYYLWIGNLTAALPGDTTALNNVVIVYDTYKDVWSFLDNHPAKVWSEVVGSSGGKIILFGSNNSGVSYRKNYSYTHDGDAIEMVVRSKYFDFNNPEKEKILSDLYVSYRPQGQVDKYITVKAAINGSNSYTTYLDSLSNTKLPLTGVSTLEYQQERVSLDGLRARTASYEFSNSDSGTNVTLIGYAQEFAYLQPNMNYTT